MTRNLLTLSCLALALAACKGDEKKATGGNASGEILPGSASDAMLPLDTVKSQAPLAPKIEAADKPATKDTGATAKPKPGATRTTSGISAEPAPAGSPPSDATE